MKMTVPANSCFPEGKRVLLTVHPLYDKLFLETDWQRRGARMVFIEKVSVGYGKAVSERSALGYGKDIQCDRRL